MSILINGTGIKLHESTKEQYIGKRLLLQARNFYSGRVPRGEDELLFQYGITDINEDCKTAQIEYKSKCIVDGGVGFRVI